MRLTKLISWMLLCGALALVTSAANAQQGTRVPGHIVVARATGSVFATKLADQSQVQLKENMVINQQYVVTTGAGSSVILVFSNGATINLGADSTLSIDEFLQDPFADSRPLAELKEEPTTSVTKLNLSRGELVGNVKHLKDTEGSSFTVATPVGAAGIRGTTFRIVFRPDATGKVFFTLSTADGRVLFEAPAAAGVSVATGTEVVVSVDVQVNATTGTVTVTTPPVVSALQEIPAATQATIAAATQQIVEASATVIIASTQQAAADKVAADKAAADKAAEDKAAADKAAADKAAADKAAADKAAADKAAADKAAADKAAADKADANKADADKPKPDEPVLKPPEKTTPPPAPTKQTTSGDGQTV